MISEFVLENFLEKNLELIEPGLKLLKRQFLIRKHGKIDLFCEDRSGCLVVIELKTHASFSAVEQMEWYKKAISHKFPKSKVRFVLACLTNNKDIPNLCKVNDIEFLQIKDNRIPKYEDISYLSFKEKQIIYHFLSDTSFQTFYSDSLSKMFGLSEKEVDKIINKINRETPLTIKTVYPGSLKMKSCMLEL